MLCGFIFIFDHRKHTDREIKVAIIIEFQPLGLRLHSEGPINALVAARQAGISLSAVCGGEGTCGKCVIQIQNPGNQYPPSLIDRKHLDDTQLASGYRLACMTLLERDTKVLIPASSILEGQVMQTDGTVASHTAKPAVQQIYLSLEVAGLHDLVSDFSRIKENIRNPNLSSDLATLRKIPPILRENNWQINLWIRENKLINVTAEPSALPLGLAVDVGSTKIACFLVDLFDWRDTGSHGNAEPANRLW